MKAHLQKSKKVVDGDIVWVISFEGLNAPPSTEARNHLTAFGAVANAFRDGGYDITSMEISGTKKEDP